MKLRYKASNKAGDIVQGFIEAKSVQEAAYFLRGKEFLPIKIQVLEEKSLSQLLLLFTHRGSGELVLFTRQLSSMLTSGLTLIQALTILQEQIQNAAMQSVIKGIVKEVEEGRTFSDALAKYPKVFSPIYISLINAGESSGFLDKILGRLADNLEKAQKLHSTIKGALMYPVIVITLMIIVMTLMMIFVIPQLGVLYDNLGVPLPLPTRIVVGLSNFTINFWWIVLGGIICIIFLFRRLSKTKSGRSFLDKVVLQLPIFGKLISQTILAEFTRTFGLLVSSGTLIVQSLKQTADVAGNTVYKKAITEVAASIERGVTLGDPMTPYKIFPPMIVEMVKIGEQTGKLDESLLKVSEYYER